MVSRTTRKYQQSRFQFGRPWPGRPRATTARNDTYLRAMARIWCHLTTRTVLIEWQTILTRVVSVSIIRVRYAEMSLNAQRRNRLLHSIWVNRAPCRNPEDNGPPWICQYPSATTVSIICWHLWSSKTKFRFLTGQCLSQTGLQVSRLDNYNFQPELLPGYSVNISIISMVMGSIMHRLRRERPLSVS